MTLQLKIHSPYRRLVPPLAKEEEQALDDSVRINGQWPDKPLTVNEKGIIVDGMNRYEKFLKYKVKNIKYVVRKFENELEEKKFIIENLLSRRNLNDFQKAELSIPLLRIEEQLAKLRKVSTLKKGKKLPLASNEALGKTAKTISQRIGMSTTTYERAKAIIKDGEPELRKKVRSGETSISFAYKQIQNRKAKNEVKDLPEGEYDIILADTPKEYELNLRGSPDSHYQTLTKEQINTMKIPTHKDCILFLWTSAPTLLDDLETMKAWGFEYKTHMVWIKDKIGNGYYVRGKHELLLIGKKGNARTPLEENRPPSVLEAPRTDHSKKPKEVYEIIEKMYPNGKYLELFAREKRDNWISWGNEI